MRTSPFLFARLYYRFDVGRRTHFRQLESNHITTKVSGLSLLLYPRSFSPISSSPPCFSTTTRHIIPSITSSGLAGRRRGGRYKCRCSHRNRQRRGRCRYRVRRSCTNTRHRDVRIIRARRLRSYHHQSTPARERITTTS